MVGRNCCGDNELPKTLVDTMLVNAELVNTVLGEGTDGKEVKAGDCLATCRDVAELKAAIKAGDDAERAHSDAGDKALIKRIDDLGKASADGSKALNDRIDGLADDLAASKNYNQGTNLPGDATDCSRPITACGVTKVLGNKDTPQAQAVRNATLDTLGTQAARDKLISDDEGNVIESRSDGLYVSRSAVSGGAGGNGALPDNIMVVETTRVTDFGDSKSTTNFVLVIPKGMWFAVLHNGDWMDDNGNIHTIRRQDNSGPTKYRDSVKLQFGNNQLITPAAGGGRGYSLCERGHNGYLEVYIASDEAMTDRRCIFKYSGGATPTGKRPRNPGNSGGNSGA